LWRAGFTVVAFIHDEVVLEVDASADLAAVKEKVDGILVSSMKEICPEILIEVKGSFRRRWGKDEEDEILLPARKDGAVDESPACLEGCGPRDEERTNGPAAFPCNDKRRKDATDAEDQQIADLQAKLQRKHEVLSELMEEHVQLKKTLGEL
jgi:hypothetical protein